MSFRSVPIDAAAGADRPIDITAFAATGGCSCKLGAQTLGEIRDLDALRAATPADHDVDDAAFVRIAPDRVLVSSVDYQNPLVSDPELSGEIGAFNALSDIFACGVPAQYAEVILAVPDLAPATQARIGRHIMAGVARACRRVGYAITGGHTLALKAPLIGLAVRGIGHPTHIKRKSGARAGDIVMMTKSVGVGAMVAAHQAGYVTARQWKAALDMLRTPNTAGAVLGQIASVTALTDITGFGLMGHATEVAEASAVTLEIDADAVPHLPGTPRAVLGGYAPVLGQANLDFAAPKCAIPDALDRADRLVLADPQTNGGLLMTVGPESVAEVTAACAAAGQPVATIGIARAPRADGTACVFGSVG